VAKLTEFLENPAYARIQEKAREISELEAEF
jgi:hypothetical protein